MPVSHEWWSADTNVLILGTYQLVYSSAYHCLALSVLPPISPGTRCMLASSENVHVIRYVSTALSMTTKQMDEQNLTSVLTNCGKSNLELMSLEFFT